MSETKQLYSGVYAKLERRFLPVIFLSALFISVVHSEAQDNARKLSETSIEELLQLDLEQVMNYEVITPTKTLTPLFKSPGSVSIITYKDIQRSSATTIPELLRLVAGVNVRWNPMVQTIDIRGFGSNPFTNRVLLMIDGVPYNSWNKGGFPQHPGFDFFSLENIKHIEVIKGSASALYGENALSGVINILTLSGEEFKQTRAKVVVGENNYRTLSVVSGDKIGDDASIFASLKVSQQQLPTDIWRENNSDAKAYHRGAIHLEQVILPGHEYHQSADLCRSHEHLLDAWLWPGPVPRDGLLNQRSGDVNERYGKGDLTRVGTHGPLGDHVLRYRLADGYAHTGNGFVELIDDSSRCPEPEGHVDFHVEGLVCVVPLHQGQMQSNVRMLDHDAILVGARVRERETSMIVHSHPDGGASDPPATIEPCAPAHDGRTPGPPHQPGDAFRRSRLELQIQDGERRLSERGAQGGELAVLDIEHHGPSAVQVADEELSLGVTAHRGP